MSTVSAEFQAHLDSDSLSLALCWKLILRDGTEYGFTTWDTAITYDGLIYKATTSMAPTSFSSNTALDIDNSEAVFQLTSFDLTLDQIRSGALDGAEIFVFYIIPDDIPAGILKQARGNVGNAVILGDELSLEFRSMTQRLTQTLGDSYIATCRAELGDLKCGVDTNLYLYTGAVTEIAVSDQYIIDALSTEIDGYYYGAVLTWLTGSNAGQTSEVMDYITSRFEILRTPLNLIEVGDTFEVYAGCDKLFATCLNKFSNSINFRGETHIPGNDKLTATGRS